MNTKVNVYSQYLNGLYFRKIIKPVYKENIFIFRSVFSRKIQYFDNVAYIAFLRCGIFFRQVLLSGKDKLGYLFSIHQRKQYY